MKAQAQLRYRRELIRQQRAAVASLPSKAVITNHVLPGPWFSHSGNFGDIIYSLPTIKKAGGGTLYLYHNHALLSHGMTRAKSESIRSLLILQPYIQEVIFIKHEMDHKLNRFREGPASGLTLADRHLQTHGYGWEERTAAWLNVDCPFSPFPVVIHRSERYHNPLFPWKEVLKKYRFKTAMVGTENEWRLFSDEFGVVPHLRTSNLLELARVIAGSKLFIGNQSCPESICEGLKHDKILEVCPYAPDASTFRRMGAVYCYDHRVELPEI